MLVAFGFGVLVAVGLGVFVGLGVLVAVGLGVFVGFGVLVAVALGVTVFPDWVIDNFQLLLPS